MTDEELDAIGTLSEEIIAFLKTKNLKMQITANALASILSYLKTAYEIEPNSELLALLASKKYTTL